MTKLIIANSQGSWADTDGVPYSKLIADNHTFCYVRSGIDIEDILKNFDDIFKTNKIDIVIFQLGIVEIANRILNDKTKTILSRIGIFGRVITKLIWINKYKWLKFKFFFHIPSYQKINSQIFVNKYLYIIDKLKSMGGKEDIYYWTAKT